MSVAPFFYSNMISLHMIHSFPFRVGLKFCQIQSFLPWLANSLFTQNRYGIALAALGMLATLSCGLTIDGFGPISDNAGGIAVTWRKNQVAPETEVHSKNSFKLRTLKADIYFYIVYYVYCWLCLVSCFEVHISLFGVSTSTFLSIWDCLCLHLLCSVSICLSVCLSVCGHRMVSWIL